MTIQPIETGLDLDLELLVGEMPAVPCESLGHYEASESDLHGGPATCYTRTNCQYCGPRPIKAYCAPFVAFCREPANGVICADCGHTSSARFVTILGPVNSFG